jgi:hypothetical protein
MQLDSGTIPIRCARAVGQAPMPRFSWCRAVSQPAPNKRRYSANYTSSRWLGNRASHARLVSRRHSACRRNRSSTAQSLSDPIASKFRGWITLRSARARVRQSAHVCGSNVGRRARGLHIMVPLKLVPPAAALTMERLTSYERKNATD